MPLSSSIIVDFRKPTANNVTVDQTNVIAKPTSFYINEIKVLRLDLALLRFYTSISFLCITFFVNQISLHFICHNVLV